MPDHLVGTREGLFHLLRGTSTAPDEDYYAQSALPGSGRYDDMTFGKKVSFNPGHLLRPEPEKIAKLMQDDEFCFVR